MSHRAHYALILDDQVRFHSDKSGGMSLPVELALGPEKFLKWFKERNEVLPDAAGALGIIPEEFAVVDFDSSILKVSSYAGLYHLAYDAALMFPQLSELIEHLSFPTPQVREAFLVYLREVWLEWEIVWAELFPPYVDWDHIRAASADEMRMAFEVLPSPQVEDAVVARLVLDLKLVLEKLTGMFRL